MNAEKWISIKEAQALLISPRTRRRPDRAVIRRWALTGRLTMRWIGYGARRYMEVLEHEVVALSRTEGRIERRVNDARHAEQLSRADADAQRQLKTLQTLTKFNLL